MSGAARRTTGTHTKPEGGHTMPGKWRNATQKWKRGMSGASQSYADGIDSVTTNPMEQAAQNEQGYLSGIQDAVSSGKWAAKLRKVSMNDWKTAAKQKGAQRLAQGAAAAEGKVQAFWQRQGPILDQVQQTVKAMPGGTLADRLARMQANAQMLHDAARAQYGS